MSIDQALLEEFYGAESEQPEDEMIKEAQAELIEAVADEAGVDLNELSDDELDKFAEYVLTDDDSAHIADPNLQTADAMGRQMAHSFFDEQEKIAHFEGVEDMYDDDMYYDDQDWTMEDTLLEKAAEWELIKESKARSEAYNPNEKADARRGSKRTMGDRARAFGRSAKSMAARASGLKDYRTSKNIGQYLAGKTPTKAQMEAFDALSAADKKKMLSGYFKGNMGFSGQKALTDAQIGGLGKARNYARARAAGKAGAVAAGVGALGYGGYRMAKQSSYDPSVEWIEDLDGVEFAKLAEFRAAEILLANGVDPETFEYVEPEHVKIANFPDPEDAMDEYAYDEIEDYNEVLDEAALDIIEDLGLL